MLSNRNVLSTHSVFVLITIVSSGVKPQSASDATAVSAVPTTTRVLSCDALSRRLTLQLPPSLILGVVTMEKCPPKSFPPHPTSSDLWRL